MLESLHLHMNGLHRPEKSSWKDIKISEMTELNLSIGLNAMAHSMVGIFVPTYLYVLNYSLVQIAAYHVLLYCARLVAHIAGASIIAKFGPKHGLIAGYLSGSVGLLLLATIPRFDWPLLVPAVFQGIHYGFYFLSKSVDFSKVQNLKKTGQQAANSIIYMRIFSVLGPLAGGFIAALLGFQWVLAASVLLTLGACIPILLTPEPMSSNLVITTQGLLSKKYLLKYISQAAVVFNGAVFNFAWPLYLTVIIISGDGFAELGLLTSLSFGFAIIVGLAVGKMSDKANRARRILTLGVLGLSLVNLGRIGVSSVLFAAILGITAETMRLMVAIPYTRRVYQESEELKGQRIALLLMYELASSVAQISLWIIIAVLFMANVEVKVVFFIVFGLASLTTPFILLSRRQSERTK